VTTMIERNADVAARLDEIADLLDVQGANAFHSRAYRRAADTVRELDEPVDDIVREHGVEGLDALPNVGPATARAIRDFVTTGRKRTSKHWSSSRPRRTMDGSSAWLVSAPNV
jgi:DNA polymerase/3'-5' exonuclease PolX